MVFCNTRDYVDLKNKGDCHNPYFNRWFSAIVCYGATHTPNNRVTILILIDGFLQFRAAGLDDEELVVTILILIDGFLQFKRGDKIRRV